MGYGACARADEDETRGLVDCFAQEREEGLGDAESADNIGFEDAAKGGAGRGLGHGDYARVVDEDVKTAVLGGNT